MAESRKGLKKVTENRKKQKRSAEKQKKHLCQKPENAILSHGNPGKFENVAETLKHNFKICGNGKSPFGSCGMPKKPQKDNENFRKPENEKKKATESRKR